MAGVEADVIFDLSELAGGLRALSTVGREDALHAAWDAIGAAMVTATRRRMRQGVSPEGAAWPASQRVLKRGGRTLIDTGRLWNSIVWHVQGNSVQWGTDLIYGAIHQYGGTITSYARSQRVYRTAKDGVLSARFTSAASSNFYNWATIGEYTITIPARPFLGIGEGDVETAGEILVRTLTARIEAGAKRGA